MSTPTVIPWTPDNQREAHRLLGALANDLASMAGSLAACDRHPHNPPPPGLLADVMRTLVRLSDLHRTLLPWGPDIASWPGGAMSYSEEQAARLAVWRQAFPTWSRHADETGTIHGIVDEAGPRP